MPTVTAHAIDRYRERFPAHARWADDEIAARIRWHAGRAAEVGNGPGVRYLADGPVKLVVRGGAVVTVKLARWVDTGNLARRVAERTMRAGNPPRGRKYKLERAVRRELRGTA